MADRGSQTRITAPGNPCLQELCAPDSRKNRNESTAFPSDRDVFLDIQPERPGFNLPSFCKIVQGLCLQCNSPNGKGLDSLVDLLYSHGFLLSRDLF